MQRIDELTPLLPATTQITEVTSSAHKDQREEIALSRLEALAVNVGYVFHLVVKELSIHDFFNLYHTSTSFKKRFELQDSTEAYRGMYGHMGISNGAHFYSCKDILDQLKIGAALNAENKALIKEEEATKNSIVSFLTAGSHGLNKFCFYGCGYGGPVLTLVIGIPVAFSLGASSPVAAGGLIGTILGTAFLGAAGSVATHQCIAATGFRHNVDKKLEENRKSREPISQRLNHLTQNGIWHAIKNKQLVAKKIDYQEQSAALTMRK